MRSTITWLWNQITHGYWYAFLSGIFTGGLLFKLVDTLILWAREKREQRNLEVSKQKDRPRFRVDVAITSANVLRPSGAPDLLPSVIIKILSLGSLPLTINQGYVAIKSNQYPEEVKPHNLDGKEISSLAPIVIEIHVHMSVLHPKGIDKTPVKLICKFSYGDGETYEDEKTYKEVLNRFE